VTARQKRIAAQDRPGRRTWLLAVIELLAALLVARLLLRTTAIYGSAHHDMSAMAEPTTPPLIQWTSLEYSTIGLAVLAGIWWLVKRGPTAAALAGVGLIVVAASLPMRTLATDSHLVAMFVLELLLVIAPLMLIAALPGSVARRRGVAHRRNRWWTSYTAATGLFYSALVIWLHTPAVHHRADGNPAPLWLAGVTLAIGLCYWSAVVRPPGAVSLAVRRAVLIGAQEVAAFVGLLSLCGAWGGSAHHSALGIPALWDQRLGGALMIATCAAVSLPLLSKLSDTNGHSVTGRQPPG